MYFDHNHRLLNDITITAILSPGMNIRKFLEKTKNKKLPRFLKIINMFSLLINIFSQWFLKIAIFDKKIFLIHKPTAIYNIQIPLVHKSL